MRIYLEIVSLTHIARAWACEKIEQLLSCGGVCVCARTCAYTHM